MNIRGDKKFKQMLALVIVGVTLFVALQNLNSVFAGIGTVIGLFLPLIVGALLAFILNVPMSFFERQIERINKNKQFRVLAKGRTAISLILTLVLLILAMYFIGSVIFPNLVEAITQIANIVNENYPSWVEAIKKTGVDISFVTEWLENFDIKQVIERLGENSKTILSTAEQAATSVFGAVTNGLLGLVLSIYMLMSKKKLAVQSRKILYAFCKKPLADEICDVATLSNRTFSGFISGQTLEAIILGILMFIALSISGFPYAATISIVIASTALIPMVGAFIGMMFGIILISPMHSDKIILFIIVFEIVQQIEGNFIYPKVVGNSIGLPSLWTLTAVILGGKAFGVLGMILFIPLFSVLYALLRRSVYTRLRAKDVDLDAEAIIRQEVEKKQSKFRKKREFFKGENSDVGKISDGSENSDIPNNSGN